MFAPPRFVCWASFSRPCTSLTNSSMYCSFPPSSLPARRLPLQGQHRDCGHPAHLHRRRRGAAALADRDARGAHWVGQGEGGEQGRKGEGKKKEGQGQVAVLFSVVSLSARAGRCPRFQKECSTAHQAVSVRSQIDFQHITWLWCGAMQGKALLADWANAVTKFWQLVPPSEQNAPEASTQVIH